MKNLKVVNNKDNKADFDFFSKNSNLEITERSKFINMSDNYYQAYYNDDVEDCSFCIINNNNEVVARVDMNIVGNILGRYQLPIEILFIKSCRDKDKKKIIDKVFCEFEKYSDRCKTIYIFDEQNNGALSELGKKCLFSRAFPVVEITARLNISVSEDEIWRNVRNSYRSLINWGKKEIQMHYVNQENTSRDDFDIYQKFHHKVSGRITRSQESWDDMYERIINGKGELSLGYMGKEVVAGNIVFYSSQTAIYSTAVYDREKFSNPISHWPLYNSILRSKNAGMKCFEAGNVPIYDEANIKEYNIGFFKKGFSDNLDINIKWIIPSN